MNRLKPQHRYGPWKSALGHATKNATASIVESSVRGLRRALHNFSVSQAITTPPSGVLLWHAFIAKTVMREVKNSVSVSVMQKYFLMSNCLCREWTR